MIKPNSILTAIVVGVSIVQTAFAAPATVVQTVTHNNQTITMRLKKENLRGAQFELWSQNSAGGYDVETPVEERSYIGTVDEFPNATSCGIVQDDGTFRGAVYFDRGVTWFTSGTGVIGTRADNYGNFSNFQWPSAPVVNPGLAGSTTYGYDLGVDADHNYFTTAGSTAKAFEQIEFSVCAVRAIYMRDVLLRPYLGRVIIRSTLAHDPYTGLTQGAYLDKVRNHWNNEQTDTDPDLVAGVSPSKIGGGLAWVGVVGTNSGYSVNQSGGTGAFDVIFRHEMGHNWNLPHYVGGSPEGAGLMGGNQPARFSTPEAKRTLDYRNSRMSVLDAEGTFTAVELAPYASMDLATFVQGEDTSVTIDPIANDHDANGQVISLAGFESNSAQGGNISQQGTNLVYQAPGSYLGVDSFSYTVSDSAGKTATGIVLVDVQPGDRLRLYLPLDEITGTNADDASVFDKNGILEGSDFPTATVAGPFGNAVNLDGADDHVRANDVRLSSNTVTLSAWIKPGASSNPFSGIIFDRTSGGNGLNLGNAGELRYHWNDNNWNWNSGLTPAANVWTFVALVIEPSKATIYMNDGSGFQTAVRNASHAVANFGNLYVGQDPAQASRHFLGAIDEVRVYNQALNQTELQQLFKGGAAEAPNPFDGATDVGPVDLQWAPAGAAVQYHVYLGTDAAAVQAATTASMQYQGAVSGAELAFPNTTLSATNFWRVDVETATETITGNVWSFTRNDVARGVIANHSFEQGSGTGVPPSWTLTAGGASSLGTGSGGADGSQFLWIGPGVEITQDLDHTLVADEILTLNYNSSRTHVRSVQLLAENSGSYQLLAETTEQTGSGGWPSIQLQHTVGSQYSGQRLALRIISGNWNEFDNFRLTIVTPPNSAPVANDATFSIAENSNAGTTIGTVVATDSDAANSLTYAISSGNAGGEFSIDSSTGVITSNMVFDFESASQYLLTVTATDDGSPELSDTATITVNVVDVNEAPTANDASGSIAENTASGALVTTVNSSDSDSGDVLTFAITSGNSGNEFAIDSNGNITTTTALNYEIRSSYLLTVTVSDSGNLTDTAAVSIAVTNVNEAPIASDTSATIAEDISTGTLVATVSATDPDAGDSLNYLISNGNTGNAFAIDGSGNITTTAELDYETTSNYSLEISVSDSGSLSDIAIVSITITDINEAPVAADTAGTVAEDAPIGTVVAAVSATDPDAGDSISFTITSGNIGSAFAIDGNGNIATATELDFETTASYALTVTATDSGNLSDTANVVITVTDVEEGPPIQQETNTISVNFLNQTTYTVSGSALGVGNWNNFVSDNSGTSKELENLLFSNGSNSGATVAIDSQAAWQDSVNTATQESTLESSYWDTGAGNGKITISSLPNSLSSNGYYVLLNVRGTDAMGANTPAEFGVRIGAEEKWVRWMRNQVDGVFTRSTHFTETSAQSSTDDQNEILLDNGGAFYTTTDLVIDVLRDPDTTNNWGRAAVSGFRIIPVPTADDASFSVAENISVGAKVGTVVLNSVDGNAPQLAISSGNPAGLFAMQQNGDIITAGNLDYEITALHVLSVTATDANGVAATATVNVNVTDVMEVAAPAVATGAASNLTQTGADIAFSVADDGGEAPTVTLYYGQTDGGNAPGNWDSSKTIGTQSAGGYTTSVSGLSAGTTYRFAIHAANSGGEAWGSTGSFTTAADSSPKLVRTTVSGVSNSSWTSVDLGQSYNSAVIIATPIYPNSTIAPVVTRIRNVSGSGFEVKIDRADGLTGAVNVDVSIVAVEAGTYTQAIDGVKMEAVKYSSTVTAENDNWTAEVRSYQNTYTNPVVVGQVMSANDSKWSAFWCQGASRNSPPSASSFSVGKHVGEDSTATRANETIGYIVIESGNGTINGVAYNSGVGGNTVRGTGNSNLGYEYNLVGLNSASAAALSIAGMNGGDGAWAVLYGATPLTNTKLTLAVDEDQVQDSERTHITERVGYIVFE